MAEEFKIRTLPRSNEKKPAVEKVPDKKQHRESGPRAYMVPFFLFVVGLCGAGFAVFSLLKPQPQGKRHISALSDNQMTIDDRVSKHMQDVEAKRELATRMQAAENDQLVTNAGSRPQPEVWDQPKDRIYGLQLDQEDSASKVYEDLNAQNNEPGEMLPEDRINARLSNAKWINEMERAEQKQFIANFIRSAHENGYEITLNEQLVVVKVRKLPGNKKVSIDKILDQLARRPAAN